VQANHAGAEMGVCEHTFQGVIRGQDVRATEKDRVKILESFRIGDVVRAVVVLFFPSLLPSFLPFCLFGWLVGVGEGKLMLCV